jgi:anti-sigma factor RsiW
MNEKYIRCDEVITFLLAYLNGELPPEKVHEFERHLAVCPSCVAYIETYKKTVSLTRGSLAEDLEKEPELSDELLKAILGARPTN